MMSRHAAMNKPPFTGHHLSKTGFSPRSKAPCSSRTWLVCPGALKSPSSSSPCSRVKHTHCSTSTGTSRCEPHWASYSIVSSRCCPKTPAATQHRNNLTIKGSECLVLGCFSNTLNFISQVYQGWMRYCHHSLIWWNLICGFVTTQRWSIYSIFTAPIHISGHLFRHTQSV